MLFFVDEVPVTNGDGRAPPGQCENGTVPILRTIINQPESKYLPLRSNLSEKENYAAGDG